MSIDSTLKRSGRLVRARNVLTREERINRLLFTWLDYAAVGRRP